MKKKKCPICGRPIESITSNQKWITHFGHDVESEDYGLFIYIQKSNDCKAPPKTYKVSEYEPVAI